MSSKKHDFRVKLIDKNSNSEYSSGKNWDELLKDVSESKLKIVTLEKRIDYLLDEMMDSNNSILFLLKPCARSQILDFISKGNGLINTRDLNLYPEIFSPSKVQLAVRYAFFDLKKEGFIVGVSQGRGKPKLWSLKK